MYGFEDFFGYAMGMIKTRSNPVASIMYADRQKQVLAMAHDYLEVMQRGMTSFWRLCSVPITCAHHNYSMRYGYHGLYIMLS